MAVIVNLNQPEILPLLRSQQRRATLLDDANGEASAVITTQINHKRRFHLKRQR